MTNLHRSADPAAETDPPEAAPSVTVIGGGPMARALAAVLLAAGRQVTVWNRTAAAVESLRERGATVAADPAAAVGRSPLTLVNVVDHGVVDEILAAAEPAVAGRTIVSLTSDTPHAAQVTGDNVAAAGGRYLDGAILTPTSTIGTEAARLVVAGDAEAFEGARSTLDDLGTVVFAGPGVTAAAAIDVAALDLFWTTIGGFLHGVELARAGGVDAAAYLPYARGIVQILPAILDDLAKRITEDRHDEPTSSVSSIHRSVSHLVAASREAGIDFAALAELRRRLGDAEQAGVGADGITRLVAAG